MAASSLPLSGLASPRTLEWIAGADLLASAPAPSTEQLSGLGPIASLAEPAAASAGLGDASLLPAAATRPANQGVLDTHAQIENDGHQVAPLNGSLHGLTNLGETVGLGHLGTPGNLVTDATGTHPASGGADSAAPLLADAGHVADAAGSLADQALAVPASGNGLVGAGGTLEPATDLLNQNVLGLHATLEDFGHQNPALNGPIHALTGLGETIGLGHVGDTGNLATDALDLPGSVLGGGGVGGAVPLVSDLGSVVGAAGTLVGSLTGAAGAGGGPLAPDGLLAPAAGLANAAVLDVHAGLEGVGHEVLPLNDAIHGLTGLGETVGLGHLGTPGNLVTDTANLPGSVLDGGGVSGVSPILGDVAATTHAAGTLLDGVTEIPGALAGGTGGAPDAGALAPVVAAVSGVAGAEGGLGALGSTLGSGLGSTPLASVLGDVTGGGAGNTHALVDASVGPQTATPAANLGVLAATPEPAHTVQIDAIGVGADQPTLASVHVLDGGSLPPLPNAGADALAGALHDVAPTAPAALDPAPSHAALDLGAAAIDLGGLADAHHADPAHAASGTHLLGL